MLRVIEEIEDGGLFDVPGWRGAAVASGVKPSGSLDLALIVADEPMCAAGVFTTSAVAAAPVDVCREQLRKAPLVRSIVINSGNANALTGARGRRDADSMVSALEEHCGGPGLVLSTGVIGVPLPVGRVLAGIAYAAEKLAVGARDVATAIRTTDTCEKRSAVRSGPHTVGGIAKGSGMIHPNMATMLAVIATDAVLSPVALRTLLKRAVDRSFHEISVDGDTSTNDAVLLLSRPQAPGQPGATGRELAQLEAAVTHVARDLAAQIVRDGEGVSRVMEIEVHHAKSVYEARRVAESIACSSLVKTALAGGDPNWGRILSAAGASGAPLSPHDMTLELGRHLVFRNGAPVATNEDVLARAFSANEVSVRLGLGRGDSLARMLTTDLTRRYVEINSEYTT